MMICRPNSAIAVKWRRQSNRIAPGLFILFLWSVCSISSLIIFPERAHADTEMALEEDIGISDLLRRLFTTGVTVTTGVEQRFESDIDDGGEVDDLSTYLGLGFRALLNPRWHVSLGVSYVFNKYDFSGSTGFGALDPWDDLHFINIVAPVTYKLSERWRFTVSPMFRISAESGADFSKGISVGGSVGAIYSFSETLALGLGVGARTQIEDDPKILLFPIIEWKFKLFGGSGSGGGKSLILMSHSSPARGAGGMLTYDGGRGWRVGLGVTSQSRRFRLDNDGVAPKGVGATSNISIWLSAIYNVRDLFIVEAYGGAAVARELKLENRNGDTILEKDVDPAPIIGIMAKGVF